MKQMWLASCAPSAFLIKNSIKYIIKLYNVKIKIKITIKIKDILSYT